MGHFSEETLKAFNNMCAEGMDFAEGAVYDFTRCLMPSGEIYGVSDGEACEVGKPIGDHYKADGDKSNVKMAYLKQAFIKRMGREMTSEETAKAKRSLVQQSAGAVLKQMAKGKEKIK